MREPLRKPISPIKETVLAWYGRLQAIPYDIRQTVVVSGSNRSGTTWVGEILNTVPGYCMISEPLDMIRVPEARAMGLGWRPYIAPGTDWPEAEAFFSKVLSGRLLNRTTANRLSMTQILSRKAWVIKSVRANGFLKWMTEKFPIRPPVLLMRHPCAVVASRLRGGHKRPPVDLHPAFVNLDPRFAKAYPRILDFLRTLDTLEEALAARWCIHYYVPLSLPKPHPWILVTYEGLVRRGESELERIFDALGMELIEDAVKRLKVPSATAKKWSNVVTGKDPLAGWTEYLTKEQVKRILRIVSAFGLDFYGQDLEPNYGRLQAWG